MTIARIKLGANGRLVIPAPLRREMGIEGGDVLIAESREGVLHLRSLDDAVARAQALVRRHVDPSRSLSDELIEERRREAAGE